MCRRLKLVIILQLACSAIHCGPSPATAQPNERSAIANGTKTVSTRLTGFSIPFKVDADDPSFVEVQLYLSRDQGKNWQLYDRTETYRKDFAFKSDGDGQYWFALRTLDRNRRLLPDGKIVEPELRVIIDTVKPNLEFRAESDAAGRVVCRWRVEDENIDPASVKITYRAAVVGPDQQSQWIPVDLQISQTVAANIYSDQLAWWPQSPVRDLDVRFEIADSAGNLASATRRVVVQHVAQLHRSSSTAYPARDPERNSSATMPPNVVCKDGVCQIQETSIAQVPKPIANVRPQTDGGIFGMLRPGLAAGQRLPFSQVGSPAEYADPPAPPPDPPSNSLPPQAANQYAAVASPSQSPGPPNDQPDSIPWESKQQRWSAKRETHEGSTLNGNQYERIDVKSNRLPEVGAQTVATPVATGSPDNKPASPGLTNQTIGQSFVKQEGDLVISQSTAVGRGRAWNHSSDTPATIGMGNQEPWKNKSNDSATDEADDQANPLVVERDEVAQSGSLPSHVAGFHPPAGVEPTTRPPLPNTELSGTQLPGAGRAVPPAALKTSAPLPPQQVPTVSGSPGTALEPQSGIPDEGAKLIINTKRFRLNYDVQAIDPSGVGRVVLWITRDGGRSWKSWATDPDNQSPFPVEVEEEGTYGFRVVIHSRDGLTGKAPSSGEAPDVWIHVDTTRPQVQITSAPYGRGDEAGRLIINWQAYDSMLPSRPIRLAYSRTLSGPWTTIATSLHNTGRYVWKVPSQVPEQIFLRIEARDQAGNASAHELATPIDLSGLSPRARIFGVEPVGQGSIKVGPSYDSSRSQTRR